MLIEPGDLDFLAGKGGALFESCFFDFLVESGKSFGVPLSNIHWDDRTSRADGGRDIIVRIPFASNPFDLPLAPSVWSCKSGRDGTIPSNLRLEITGGQRPETREALRRHLSGGGHYVWCALHSIDEDTITAFERERDKIADDLKISRSQIAFRWRTHLLSNLREFPGVAFNHLPKVAESNNEVFSLKQWAVRENFHSTEDWHNFEHRNKLKVQIADHLRHPPSTDNVLFIAGLSGIGKSRTVWQACQEASELCNTLYIPGPSMGPNPTWLRSLESSQTLRATIVIDDVNRSECNILFSRVSALHDRVRAIIITPSPQRERSRNLPRSTLELPPPSTEEAVYQVIKKRGETVQDSVLRSIAKASHHDLRLAILLTEASSQNPDLRELPVTNLEEVWSRVVTQFPRSSLGTKQSRYDELTTSIDIGHSKDHRRELEYLANHFQTSAIEYDRMIEEAKNCGLGIKSSLFFEAVPMALAAWIFQDRLWPVLKPTVDQFLKNMPTERLRRRFIERGTQCTDPIVRGEVADAHRFFTFQG